MLIQRPDVVRNLFCKKSTTFFGFTGLAETAREGDVVFLNLFYDFVQLMI